MMKVDSEWVYLISDTNNVDTDVAADLINAVDGNNVAFVYNVSVARQAACAVSYDKNLQS